LVLDIWGDVILSTAKDLPMRKNLSGEDRKEIVMLFYDVILSAAKDLSMSKSFPGEERNELATSLRIFFM